MIKLSVLTLAHVSLLFCPPLPPPQHTLGKLSEIFYSFLLWKSVVPGQENNLL